MLVSLLFILQFSHIANGTGSNSYKFIFDPQVWDWKIALHSDSQWQLGIAFTRSNITTIYCICVNTHHFSFKTGTWNLPGYALTRPRTYLYQFKAVHKSHLETILTRCYSFTLYATGRQRVVGNAKGHLDLFQCANYHVCAIINNCTQRKLYQQHVW